MYTTSIAVQVLPDVTETKKVLEILYGSRTAVKFSVSEIYSRED